MLSNRIFRETVMVKRFAQADANHDGTPDSGRGNKPVGEMTETGTAPACWQRGKGREVTDGKDILVCNVLLLLPAGVDIRRRDVVVRSSSGESAKVVDVRDPGGMGHHLEIDAVMMR